MPSSGPIIIIMKSGTKWGLVNWFGHLDGKIEMFSANFVIKLNF